MISKIRELASGDRSIVLTSPARSPSTDSSDNSLIERIASGDKLAMHVLYTRHHMRVYRFAFRFVDDGGVAEDLVNEVFLDVWRKARAFEGRSQVSTWLLAITRHKALEVLRRRSPEQLDEDASESIADTSDNPEVAMQKKQKGAILFNCLTKLSPAHREIIDLVYYHEKSIDDVAEITGIVRSTVKTRMFYARKHLAELLGQEGIVTA
jgi:RNA polymerase sigma-70 factor, ECF subfamily